MVETVRCGHETDFFDVRLGIGARINCEFMIGCTYRSEKTLEDSFIYVRFQKSCEKVIERKAISKLAILLSNY